MFYRNQQSAVSLLRGQGDQLSQTKSVVNCVECSQYKTTTADVRGCGVCLSVSRHSRANDSINLKMTAVQHAAASGVRLHNRAHVQPVAVSLLNPKHGFLSLSLFIKWKITLNYVDLGNFQDSLSNFMYDSLIDCSEGHIWKQTYSCVNK